MTELTRKVSRRTRAPYSVLFREPRPIVASLIPGDLLQFREAGRRDTWEIPISSAFKYAVRLKALSDATEKRRARKAKRSNP